MLFALEVQHTPLMRPYSGLVSCSVQRVHPQRMLTSRRLSPGSAKSSGHPGGSGNCWAAQHPPRSLAVRCRNPSGTTIAIHTRWIVISPCRDGS